MSTIGTVNSVTLIEDFNSGISCCSVNIDFDTVYVFEEYAALTDLIGKKVSYDVRREVYKGVPVTVACNIADLHKIQTVEKTKDIRLVPERSDDRVGCNIDISTLKLGDLRHNCVAFLSSYTLGRSDKAEWVDCVMVDMKSKTFSFRIFVRNGSTEDCTVEEAIAAKVGHYVRFSITATKFGFQQVEDTKLDLVDVPVLLPPEVEVAIGIIVEAAKEDEALLNYMNYFDYIERLKKIIDIEMGYTLVEIASEISMIQAIQNISDIYDKKTMIRTAIASRGYLLPAKTKFSRPVLNVTKVLKTELGSDRELLLILDPAAEEEASPTKRMYMDLASFTSRVVNERRGLNEEINEHINLDALRRRTGGLF